MAEIQERANSESIGFPRDNPAHEVAEPASLDWDRVGHRALLDASIRRLTTPNVPIPYNAELMRAVLPSTRRIQAAIEELLTF